MCLKSVERERYRERGLLKHIYLSLEHEISTCCECAPGVQVSSGFLCHEKRHSFEPPSGPAAQDC
eukprot:jgi/Botrbrau1/4251/Bobra.0044s0046.1